MRRYLSIGMFWACAIGTTVAVWRTLSSARVERFGRVFTPSHLPTFYWADLVLTSVAMLIFLGLACLGTWGAFRERKGRSALDAYASRGVAPSARYAQPHANGSDRAPHRGGARS